MTMMSHTVSGRVRYGGFGFGFGFGVRYSEVRWVGMGLGGAADRVPAWQIKRVQEPM